MIYYYTIYMHKNKIRYNMIKTKLCARLTLMLDM